MRRNLIFRDFSLNFLPMKGLNFVLGKSNFLSYFLSPSKRVLKDPF